VKSAFLGLYTTLRNPVTCEENPVPNGATSNKTEGSTCETVLANRASSGESDTVSGELIRLVIVKAQELSAWHCIDKALS